MPAGSTVCYGTQIEINFRQEEEKFKQKKRVFSHETDQHQDTWAALPSMSSQEVRLSSPPHRSLMLMSPTVNLRSRQSRRIWPRPVKVDVAAVGSLLGDDMIDSS